MTVQDMIDKLGKLPPHLPIKHHRGNGFVRNIKDCRVVADDKNTLDDPNGEQPQESSFVCIY